MLSLEQLKQIMPRLQKNPIDSAALYPHLVKAMAEAEINTSNRIAMWLAQLGHESLEFRYMEELADGSAYEGRKDLGNTQAGDGKLYKGRGPLQLTGRLNYTNYGNALGVDLVTHPDRAASYEVGFRVAALYWKKHDLNTPSDKGDVLTVTKRINGGTNGLDDRTARYNRALSVL